MIGYLNSDPRPTDDELDRLTRRMASGEPFTYGALAAGGLDKHRAADKQIQKWRRNGWISFTRENGRVVWRLTEAGTAATSDLRS